MSAGLDSLAWICPPEACTERTVQIRRQGNTGPTGRQVSTFRFLDAYLHHGAAARLIAIVPGRQGATAFDRLWKDHPGVKARRRARQLVGTGVFHSAFFPVPPARVVHTTGLLPASHAWSRWAHGPHAFALSGIVHSLSESDTLGRLAEVFAAPLMPYDTLICPSQATRSAVAAALDAVEAARGESAANSAGGRPRIEVIPWGVDPQRFRPATAKQKADARSELAIAADEFVVVSVGRLSFHGRANPYPLFQGLYHAGRAARKKVRLLLVGWATNEHIQRAFLDGARIYAPTVVTTHIVGAKPEELLRALQAADLFAGFPDSYQESQGLTLLEAMAAGLPVVASDWAGYRDLVVPDQTGLLVPTCIVPGAAPEAMTRLWQGEINETTFLTQTTQTVVVDGAATVRAFTALMASGERCRAFGAAGRRRVEEHHSWQRIVAAYDRLWAEQEQVRAAHAAREPEQATLAGHLAPERLFAAHATRLLGDEDLVKAVPEHEMRLHRLGTVAMTSFSADTRCTDLVVLRRVLDAAARAVPVRELDSVFRQAGVGRAKGRAALAWMLKYGLLAFV